MVPEVSLPCTQQPATVRIMSQIHPVCVPILCLEDPFNIILLSTPRFSKWSPSLRFPHKTLAQTQSWRTTLLRLSETAYSIYLQLLSISGGRLSHPQREDALCHADKDPLIIDILNYALGEI
jgi:hypothetical protein